MIYEFIMNEMHDHTWSVKPRLTAYELEHDRKHLSLWLHNLNAKIRLFIFNSAICSMNDLSPTFSLQTVNKICICTQHRINMMRRIRTHLQT